MIHFMKTFSLVSSLLIANIAFSQTPDRPNINNITSQELRSRLREFLNSPSYSNELKQIEPLCDLEPDTLDYSHNDGKPSRFNLQYLPKPDKTLSEDDKKKIEKIVKDPLLENFLGQSGMADTDQIKAIKNIMAVSPRDKSAFDPITNIVKKIDKALEKGVPANSTELQNIKNSAGDVLKALNQGAVPSGPGSGSGAGGGGPGSGSGAGGPSSGAGNGGSGSGAGGGGPGSSGAGGGGPGSGSGAGGPGSGAGGGVNPPGRALAQRGLERLINDINNRIAGTTPLDSSKPTADLSKE